MEGGGGGSVGEGARKQWARGVATASLVGRRQGAAYDQQLGLTGVKRSHARLQLGTHLSGRLVKACVLRLDEAEKAAPHCELVLLAVLLGSAARGAAAT